MVQEHAAAQETGGDKCSPIGPASPGTSRSRRGACRRHLAAGGEVVEAEALWVD